MFYEKARGLSLEGIVSKRADAPYAPTNRGLWVKIKCLHREEIRGRRLDRPGRFPPGLGALLLAILRSARAPCLCRPRRGSVLIWAIC